MKPFIGYNVGDYWAHWLEMGKILGDKAPKIFNVNWFKQDEEGNFLWPGFGDNMRVLDWIIKRCEGTVDAVETAIGYLPKKEDLNLTGIEDEVTPAVLDKLHDAGRQAAFFLPTDTSKWDDDLVRRIAAEGHTVAFLLQADSKTDGADMLADLAAANERLTLLTGVAARIAANQSGSDALTEAQRSVLIGAGYRLWDAGLDSGDAEKNAAEAYTQTVQYFASTSGVVVVRLHHSKATPRLTEALCSYIGRQGISAGRITYSTAPVNSASDIR